MQPLVKAIILVVLFSVTACVRKIPLMRLGDFPLSVEDGAKLSEIITRRQSDLKTVKALYYTTIQYGETRERLRQLFLYEEPGKFRAEILPTTSTYSLGLLIASGGKAQYVDNQSGEVINSDSVRSLIYDTLRYDAEPQELLHALLGFLPGNVEYYNVPENSVRVYSDSENYIADISPASGTINKAQFLDQAEKRVVMQVEYKDYKEYSGRLIPSALTIKFPRGDVTAELKASHMEINKIIPPKNFEFLISGH